MPLTSTTPVAGPATNRNGVSDRRAAPAKQANSTIQVDWPLLTKSAYIKVARGQVADVDDRIRRLAQARNAIWAAKQAIDAALHATNPQVSGDKAGSPIYNRLRSQAEQIDKLVVGFPLQVV